LLRAKGFAIMRVRRWRSPYFLLWHIIMPVALFIHSPDGVRIVCESAARDSIVVSVFLIPAMNWHHFLLISPQDSIARSMLPNVLPRQDRLSVATNPFDALALMREAKLDAVLVAFEDQDQDAAVMCKTLRRQSKLPIVMLVNSATRSQITRGYRLGADAHIEIPCDPRVFRARVAAVLREFQSEFKNKKMD
jgi:CheY-like chemotaxis protein